MSTLVWDIHTCPKCGTVCPVGIMSLSATCPCGCFYTDTQASQGWYGSVEAYLRGDPKMPDAQGVSLAELFPPKGVRETP